MKVLVSSTGRDLNSDVSHVFARCPFFFIADIENKKIKRTDTIENTSSRKSGGAGISAAQKVAETGAKAVITGNMGPRAEEVLKQFGIKIYIVQGKVGDALNLFNIGGLKESER